MNHHEIEYRHYAPPLRKSKWQRVKDGIEFLAFLLGVLTLIGFGLVCTTWLVKGAGVLLRGL
jgi:hypothetical protein